ncbi:hypothetical protein DY000_02030782 [Brassica cretica]|uniref:Uncharacterized protein n=1 Tax=Brassica cretica TaxID=69181 RepID=A0ABQ7DPK8_BRACR|nr:hypothetical protein DY000_02030782 [Brassica cretica]
MINHSAWKPEAGGRTQTRGGRNPEHGGMNPEAGGRNLEAGSWSNHFMGYFPQQLAPYFLVSCLKAGNNMIFFIGLREFHHGIKLLVEFGVGCRLVARVFKLPYRDLVNALRADITVAQDQVESVRLLLLLYKDETLPPWWGLVGVGHMLDGEAGNVCIKAVASCIVSGLYPDLRQRDVRHVYLDLEIHPSETHGSWVRFFINRRLYGLSSRNPETGWTFVQKPRGWMDFRPGTRRLDGLSSRNPEAGWTIVGFLEQCLPLSKPGSVFRCVIQLPFGRLKYKTRCVRFVNLEYRDASHSTFRRWVTREIFPRDSRTWRCCWDPEVSLGSEGRFLSPEAALDPKDPEIVLNPEVALDLEVFLNPEVSFGPECRFEPGGCSRPEGRFEPGGFFWTRGRFEPFLLDPNVVLNPEVALGPKVVLNPEVSFGLEVVLNRSLEVYLFQALRSFQDPETAWGPEGTVFRLTRQDYYRYLFGFRILPLGSWPLSSYYVVFYFCRKSLTSLEGAGMGVMTQVPGFAAFHEPRCALGCTWVLGSFDSTLRLAQTQSCFILIPIVAPCTNSEFEYSTLRLYLCLLRCCRNWHVSYDATCVRISVQYFALSVLRIQHGSRLLSRRMDAGVGAGAFLNRELEAGVLPEAWMILPNQFAPYFSISFSNSGNKLCSQVNRSCSFSSGFPWAGHRSSIPSFPDLKEKRSKLQWASTSACRWQVPRAWREQDVAPKSPFLGSS